MDNIEIKNIDNIIIKKYKREAEKEKLCFCKKTNMYGIYVNKKFIGFAGIIINKNKIIFKNDYIIKENRGNGYYKYIMEFRILIAKEYKIKIIEAVCTEKSINTYLKYGFKIIKEYKNGCKKVINENI